MRYALLFGIVGLAWAQRVTVPLDGEWQISESRAPEPPPATFAHRGPVPGLANLAVPPLAGVDDFDSREIIDNRIRKKMLPASAAITGVGVPRQDRNWLWYARTFKAPAKKQVAILRINKAQFGTAVWLNGKKIGEHHGCFTAGYFHLNGAIDWAGENRLVVRIGAHPAVLPESVPAGTDFEKNKWTPGIYDSVSLILAGNPVIESVQVAPRIQRSEIVIQTVVKNYGAAARSFVLAHKAGGAAASRPLQLGPGEEQTFTDTLRMPGAKLWSPEDPVLHTLETDTGGDSAATRFGMREFRFDTATRRAYLNGRPYFLRGSNITLHRFFEDPNCKRLPWDRQWVRKLLAEIPKRMHWNSFRFCIGPVPDFWLDIADEAGLLIQNEYFIWTGRNAWHKEWTADSLVREYKEWMHDNWNHPSVAIWDANNETIADVLGDSVIPAVRGLDLSNRPWENGYNLPAGPDDPVEDHPYLFGQPKFMMTDLERQTGPKSTNSGHPTGHAVILNEYGWLWLNRDGSPTELTRAVYERLAGGNASADERFAMNAYLLAGLTEYWRAHRNFVGVLHFVYLTSSYPGAYTSDHFRDVEKLELEPHFAEWVGEAFRPLGVYINFWQPTLAAGSTRRFPVAMINDEPRPVRGTLSLALDTAVREVKFEIPAFGQQSYAIDLTAPAKTGPAMLTAKAQPEGAAATLSRRRVNITEPRP